MSPIRRFEERAPALPRIGILRKGAPRPEKGDRPGADLPHFRFVSDDAALVARFRERYGPEPVAIPIYLAFGTVDASFSYWQEEWVAGGLKHRCDGERCVLKLHRNGIDYDRWDPCDVDAPACPGGCKAVGRLAVILPDLERLGSVTVLTTSGHDIRLLLDTLRAYEALTAFLWTTSALHRVRFILSRRVRSVSTPDRAKGQRSRRAKSLLHLEPSPEWAQLQIAAMREAALPPTAAVLRALPAPSQDGQAPAGDEDEEDDDEGVDGGAAFTSDTELAADTEGTGPPPEVGRGQGPSFSQSAGDGVPAPPAYDPPPEDVGRRPISGPQLHALDAIRHRYGFRPEYVDQRAKMFGRHVLAAGDLDQAQAGRLIDDLEREGRALEGRMEPRAPQTPPPGSPRKPAEAEPATGESAAAGAGRLCEELRQKAAAIAQHPGFGETVPLPTARSLAADMSRAFLSDDARHEVIRMIFGKQSCKDLTRAEAKVLRELCSDPNMADALTLLRAAVSQGALL